MPGSTNCSPGLRTRSTVHPAAHSSGVRSSCTPVTARRGMRCSTGIATPACTVTLSAVRAATKLQQRARTSATSAAHTAQKTAPAHTLCQKAKGAQTSPGTAAQTQSTRRARGGSTSAVCSSSCSLICGRKDPTHPSADAGCRPVSGTAAGPTAAAPCCREG